MDGLTQNRVNAWAKTMGLEDSLPVLFEKYATNIYLNRELKSNLQKLDEVVNGGGDDGGVDAAAVIINGEIITDPDDVEEALHEGNQNKLKVFFLQAKTSEKYNMPMLSKFLWGVKAITEAASTGISAKTPPPPAWRTMADTLHVALENILRFDQERVPCELLYVTTADHDGTESVENDQQVQDALKVIEKLGIYKQPLSISSQGRSEIYQRYQELNGPINVKFEWEKKSTIPSVDENTQAYIGLVRGTELKKILMENGVQRPHIFDANVRLYQGEDNDVNKNIRQTLNSEDAFADFPFLNNGLTIVANEMRTSGDSVILNAYHVVNGGQTSVEIIKWIGGLSEDNQSKLNDLLVPLKVISSADSDFRSKISTATNLQTTITDSDIQSSSFIAQEVEAYFEGTGEDGLRFKRQSRAEPLSFTKTRVVGTEDINKAVNSCIFGDSANTIRKPKELNKPDNPIWIESFPHWVYYFSASIIYRIQRFIGRNEKIEIDTCQDPIEAKNIRAATYHLGMMSALFLEPELIKIFENESAEYPQIIKKLKKIDPYQGDIENKEVIAKIDEAILQSAIILTRYFTEEASVIDFPLRPLKKDDVRAVKHQQQLVARVLNQVQLANN
ncbi:AIPR family protein [Arcanobacterium phocae]|uniref:AIPR family protein n=1 Tax=Arcanobacterium phocae TaxID=131112 RepID=UPI001C0EFDC4|nr:AIPR family protein [Arcanobacterium phocae]